MAAKASQERMCVNVRYDARMKEQFGTLASELNASPVPKGKPWGRYRRVHDAALRDFLATIDLNGPIGQFMPLPASLPKRSLYLDPELVEQARSLAERFDLPVVTVIYTAFARFLERKGHSIGETGQSSSSEENAGSSANAA